MTGTEANIAAVVILAWFGAVAFVAYRAGRQSKPCCHRRWGHDSPRTPNPDFPGISLPKTTNPSGEVIFRSRAVDGG